MIAGLNLKEADIKGRSVHREMHTFPGGVVYAKQLQNGGSFSDLGEILVQQ